MREIIATITKTKTKTIHFIWIENVCVLLCHFVFLYAFYFSCVRICQCRVGVDGYCDCSYQPCLIHCIVFIGHIFFSFRNNFWNLREVKKKHFYFIRFGRSHVVIYKTKHDEHLFHCIAFLFSMIIFVTRKSYNFPPHTNKQKSRTTFTTFIFK